MDFFKSFAIAIIFLIGPTEEQIQRDKKYYFDPILNFALQRRHEETGLGVGSGSHRTNGANQVPPVFTVGTPPCQNATNILENMTRIGITEFRENYCLSNTQASLHSTNHWIKGSTKWEYLNGTTYWLNEFMAVGHVMYDIGILELLSSNSIERIVLQRAPCATHDLCLGVGTWASFFEGFYKVAVSLSDSNVPIFVRFSKDDLYWHPRYLHMNDTSRRINESRILVQSAICFQRAVKRKCNRCFKSSVSVETVKKFKEYAYALAQKPQFHLATLPHTDLCLNLSRDHSFHFKFNSTFISSVLTFNRPLLMSFNITMLSSMNVNLSRTKMAPMLLTIAHR